MIRLSNKIPSFFLDTLITKLTVTACVINHLAAEINTFKQGLGDKRGEQYGADNRFFNQCRTLYGSWLTLGAIKSAARRQRQKSAASSRVTPGESTTLITPVVGTPASATTTAFRLQPLASHIPDPIPDLIPDSQVVSSSKPANKGGRPKGSTNQAKEDLARRKVLATDLIARKYKEAQDVNPGKQLSGEIYEQIHSEALGAQSLQNFRVKKSTIDRRI